MIISWIHSSLAQTYMTMEALADAGVREGIPRELSTNLVAQTLIGQVVKVRNTL